MPVRSLVEFHRSAFRYFRKHASSASAIVTPLVWISLKLRLLFKLAQLCVKPAPRLKTAELTADTVIGRIFMRTCTRLHELAWLGSAA